MTSRRATDRRGGGESLRKAVPIQMLNISVFFPLQLSAIVDSMLDKLQEIEVRSEDVLRKTKEMLERTSAFLDQIKILEETCRTLALRIEDAVSIAQITPTKHLMIR